MLRRRAAAALTVVALLTSAACGNGEVPAASGPSSGAAAVSGTVTVFAASSLTGAFTQLAKDFEAEHPGVKVTLSFAGSSALAQQINQGAPADVFASAAPKNLEQVADHGTAVTFVRNRLEIAVPKGNPAGITGLADFGDAGRKIALCAEQVPCGAAANKVLEVAGITPRPDSLEQDVKAALTKVRLGEVDAALVYRTDVLAAGSEVEGIEFPESAKVVSDYPIATLPDGPNAAGGEAFVKYVLSAKGRALLSKAGFEAP
ncbi:MAG TPA: molybdate ABC transporter substrate-binding protein [Kribbella sp.]|nr:molybdate ABC transporter substrate-binding protein [Kribbella sp.]